MRKILSIFFAIIILVAGMHFTIATHYCGGRIAAVRITLTGNAATCGMEHRADQPLSESDINLVSNCCKDVISIYALDDNYSPSGFQFKTLTFSGVQPYLTAPSLFLPQKVFPSLIAVHTGPPGQPVHKATDLTFLCLFQI